MRLENLELMVNGINYLNNINYQFTYEKIYCLFGDTSVNVFLRVLCGIIKETTGQIIKEKDGVLNFFLNDMDFIADFTVLETIQDISLKSLDKTKVSDFLVRLNMLDVSNFKLSKCSKEIIKKLGILCTLVNDNKLILIEDIFKDLSPSAIDRVKDLFFYLKSQGYIIILTGRNKEDFDYFADNVLRIEKGNLYEVF